MKNRAALAALVCLFSARPHRLAAQQLPADTGTVGPELGFSLPRIGGTLNYGLSIAELVSTGFYGSGAHYSTDFSGDLAYISKSERHPFSAVYAGGVLLANSNQPNTYFQTLSFSQVLNTEHWNVTAADSVSYLPQSPTQGLSGIPGVGDLGVDPVAIDPGTGIGILTTYGPRVSNTVSISVGRPITSRVSAQGTGQYAIQRFIGDNATFGLNTDSYGGSGGVSYHFSARNIITGNYNYNHFSYGATGVTFDAQGATLEYSRFWSPRISTEFYGGPQVISGAPPFISKTATTVAAGANVSFLDRRTSYSLSYGRGANNGSGVIGGAISDSLNASARHQFGREWLLSGNAGYSRVVSLPNFTLAKFESRGLAIGAQASRRFGRSLFGYGSYTVEHQSVPQNTFAGTALNTFSGNYQVFGFGLTYSPRGFLLGR